MVPLELEQACSNF